jgi:hypothetical protein
VAKSTLTNYVRFFNMWREFAASLGYAADDIKLVDDKYLLGFMFELRSQRDVSSQYMSSIFDGVRCIL